MRFSYRQNRFLTQFSTDKKHNFSFQKIPIYIVNPTDRPIVERPIPSDAAHCDAFILWCDLDITNIFLLAKIIIGHLCIKNNSVIIIYTTYIPHDNYEFKMR